MLAAPLFHFFAVVSLFVSGQENGNELVSPFPYLASNLFEAHVVSELQHGFLPGESMEIHRVKKCTVQVEDCGFRQVEASRVCVAP